MIPKQPDPVGGVGQVGDDGWAELTAGHPVEWSNDYAGVRVDDIPVDQEFIQMNDAIRRRLRVNPLPDADRFLSLLEHLDQALACLSSAERIAIDAAADPEALFDTTELHRSITNMVDRTQGNMVQLGRAMLIVAENRPLATAFPNGERWGGKMAPRQVGYLCEHADAGGSTVTCLQGRANAALAQATDTTCSGGSTNQPCNGVRVRRAGGTRTSSCWPHLTKDEKAEVRAEREAAMKQPCSQCQARPGEPCVEFDGRPTTIHHYRVRPDAILRRP